MGKKRLYKLDSTGSQIEDKDAEALEADDPTLDANGDPIVDASKKDSTPVAAATGDAAHKDATDTASPSATTASDAVAAPANTDAGDAKKSDTADSATSPSNDGTATSAKDAASSTAEPAKADPQDSPDAAKPIPITDLSLPLQTDTADNAIKDQDGKVVDDHGTSVMPEQLATADTEAKKDEPAVPSRANLEGSFEPAKGTEADQGIPLLSPAAAALPSDDQVVKAQIPSQEAVAAKDAPAQDAPATGSAEALTSDAKAADEAPKPKDPATLPGMTPVATIGEAEATGGLPAPTTAIDGVMEGQDVPALGDMHDKAQPIADALDPELLNELKQGGDTLSGVLVKLRAAEPDLLKLGGEARAIAVHVKTMGLHFVSALEAMFKRK